MKPTPFFRQGLAKKVSAWQPTLIALPPGRIQKKLLLTGVLLLHVFFSSFSQEKNFLLTIYDSCHVRAPRKTIIPFAVAAVGAPLVRVAYIIPSNRTPQPNAEVYLQHAIKTAQQWYKEQMEQNGFGVKTFLFETEADGITPLVHVVQVTETDDYLRGDIWGRTLQAAINAGLSIWASGEVWVVMPETHVMAPDGTIAGGVALGASNGTGNSPGVCMIGSNALPLFKPEMIADDTPYEGKILAALGSYPLKQDLSFAWFEGTTFSSVTSSYIGALLHEMGHAFGLAHDFRNDNNFHGNLMGNGLRGMRGSLFPAKYPQDVTRLEYAAGLILSVSHYFNRDKTVSASPSLHSYSPAPTIPQQGLVHFSFEASDDDSLGLAQLRFDGNIVAEVVLKGTRMSAEFAVPYYTKGIRNVYTIGLHDKQGNAGYYNVQLAVPPGYNQAPVPFIRIDPAIPGTRSSITLDASHSHDVDHQLSSLTAAWDVDNDGQFDIEPSTNKTIQYNYARPGNYLIRLKLRDPDGGETISTPVSVKILRQNNTAVESFTLIDAETGERIADLKNGMIITMPSLASKKYNIRANTSPGVIDSVRFELSGSVTHESIDQESPYTLFAKNRQVAGRKLLPGEYTLAATPYTSSLEGITFSVSFKVKEMAPNEPIIAWDKTIGGAGFDWLKSTISTHDGGYLLAGNSTSNASGDKSENGRGRGDYWIVKLDSLHNKVWDKTFGGADVEEFSSMITDPGGGFLLSGYSFSDVSGEKSENGKGEGDYWIVKIDNQGNKVWDKTFGGTGRDVPFAATSAPDGGYLLVGFSESDLSGDKSENSKGDSDYWIVKIDDTGNKVWDRTFGGSSGDNPRSITLTPDGGYLLGGSSMSMGSGDKSEDSKGLSDYWVVKVDNQGNKVWDKTIGGSDDDNLVNTLLTPDGGYLMAGDSRSNASRDKSEDAKGNWDYWVLKLDSEGNKVWDRTYGGSNSDGLSNVVSTADGGYLLSGSSNSDASADKREDSRGYSDYWILKIDAAGDKLWDKTLGGSEEDNPFCTILIPRGYLIAGTSASGASDDKSENSKGNRDYWVVALETPNIYSVGAGTGLRAEYFNNIKLSGTPDVSRVDQQVDFTWNAGSPASGINADNFSVRWTGQVEAPVTGSYVFSTVSDDGVRLWINGVQVINNWTDHAPTVNNSPGILLAAGTKYHIRMEFYEHTLGAVATLLWSYPGQARQPVPKGRLFPAVPGGTGTGLRAEYFNNISLAGLPAVNRLDKTIDFTWNAASPLPGINADNFSVRWTGQVEAPVTGNYVVSTVSDDGIRLWINGTQVISNWMDHAPVVNNSSPMPLTAGIKYDIKMEFYEHTVGAVARLLWAYPGQVQQPVPPSRLYPGAPETGGNGTGLRAEYFNNMNLTGVPVVNPVDSQVNFTWNTASPVAGVHADNFSVRWTGQVEAPMTGNYFFSTVSDDGVRLWINDIQVINNWTDHGPTVDNTTAIPLTAGTRYNIRMEFYERTLGAVAKLLWTYPGQTRQAVPQRRLYPAEEGCYSCECMESPLTLRSQADVDAFTCVEYDGMLVISGSDITNLRSLSSLKRAGSIVISDNPRLSSLTGLDALERISSDRTQSSTGLTISRNAILTNIDALISLQTIVRGPLVTAIEISDNPVLKNINGLVSITSLEAGLSITNNASLENIDGLKNLTEIKQGAYHGYVTIRGNASLKNLDGFSSLRSIDAARNGGLFIQNNPLLANIDGLSLLTAINAQIGGGLVIENNASLKNLNGLKAVSQIGWGPAGEIRIQNNSSLENVDGLSSVKAIGFTGGAFAMVVVNNPMLARCCGLFPILSLLSPEVLNQLVTMNGNGSNCTKEDIMAGGSCAAPKCDDPIVVLRSQKDVDAFSCTSVAGHLLISGPDITNVLSLSSLTSAGSIAIVNNPKLASLDGLDKLVNVSPDPVLNMTGVTISGNAILTNIDALSSLRTIGRGAYVALTIYDNPMLNNVDGLISITSLNAGVTIASNARLENIDGLRNLTEIKSILAEPRPSFNSGHLAIRDNPSLKNINGLSSLEILVASESAGVYIENNPLLTNIDGLSSLTAINAENRASLAIAYNDNLKNLDGLRSLTSITWKQEGSISIQSNPALENVDGLSSIRSLGYWPAGTFTMTVIDNQMLTRCCGLFSILSLFSPEALKTVVTIKRNGSACTLENIVAGGHCHENGIGLRAEYFNNADLTGSPVLSRVDQLVDFTWNTASPVTGINADKFSVRWSGQVEAPATGNYVFSTISDDGVRLWINGVQVINNWTIHSPTVNNSSAMPLVAGNRYDIRMEFFDHTLGAVARLLWSYPGQSQQPVPQARLYPAGASAAARAFSTDLAPGAEIISIQEDSKVVVYPNPVGNVLNVIVYSDIAEEVGMSLQSSSAPERILLRSTLAEGENHFEIPVNDLRNGLYILTLTLGSQKVRTKIMIAK